MVLQLQVALWPQRTAPTSQKSSWESASNVDEKGTKVWTGIQTKSSASGARDAEITPTIPRIAEKGAVTQQKSHFNVKNKY